MSVRGVGMDIVDVDKFASLVAESGTSFEDNVFTSHELDAADRLHGSRRDQHLASRFAVTASRDSAWLSSRVSLVIGAKVTASRAEPVAP